MVQFLSPLPSELFYYIRLLYFCIQKENLSSKLTTNTCVLIGEISTIGFLVCNAKKTNNHQKKEELIVKKSKSRVNKDTVATRLNEQHGGAHIPDVGGKMFRRTSESAGSID